MEKLKKKEIAAMLERGVYESRWSGGRWIDVIPQSRSFMSRKKKISRRPRKPLIPVQPSMPSGVPETRTPFGAAYAFLQRMTRLNIFMQAGPFNIGTTLELPYF